MRSGVETIGIYTDAEREILASHPAEGALHFAQGWDRARVRRAAEAVARTDAVLRDHARRRLVISLEPAVPSMRRDGGGPARKPGSPTAWWPAEDELAASPDAARLLAMITAQSGIFGYVGLPSLSPGGHAMIRPIPVRIELGPPKSASARAAAPRAWAALEPEDRSIVAALGDA